MKSLYFYVGHRDQVGGGALALYHLAVALQEMFDVHLSSDWHPDMEQFEFLMPPERPWKFKRIPEQTDVYLASAYNECPVPFGKVNVFYTFFPRVWWTELNDYKHVVTISEYSRLWVQNHWLRDAEVVVGGAFREHYAPIRPKENVILSCSRFFMEGDVKTLRGHSKGQHRLIEAFLMAKGTDSWKLQLAGSVLCEDDSRYLKACQDLAKGDPRIEFYPMANKSQIRDLYGHAKVFAHAMGFERENPAETEHFGFCVEKALLSGCRTVVCDRGGAAEMGHYKFSNIQELVFGLEEAMNVKANDTEKIAAQNDFRTWKTFCNNVRRVFGKWA